MRRLLRLLLILAIAFVAVFGMQWYRYVTNTTTPYDEVGIDINSWMPGPLNAWGCRQLRATFGTAPPPYGCQRDGDPKQWR